MSLYINQVNIGSVLDSFVQIDNDQIGRAMYIGSGWNTIWVTLRLNVGGSATLVTPTFALGLCSGTTNMFKDATTDNFVGSVSSGNATYTAGTPNFYTFSMNHSIRVGTTTTNSTPQTRIVTALSSDRFVMMGVQIRKISSSSMGLRLWGPSNTVTGTTHKTYVDWYTHSELATVFVNPTGYSTSTEVAVAVDEAANGFLDTVNVSWAVATPLNITDIGYAVKR